MTVTCAPDRSKTTTACYNCRQRKLRCDGSKPSCSNCRLYIAECSYAQARNKSGPPRGSKRQSTVNAGGPPQKRSKRSSPQSSSNASPTSTSSAASPIQSLDHTIPSLIGPLSSEWFTEWSLPENENLGTNSNLTTTWTFPGMKDDTDPVLIPEFRSDSSHLTLSSFLVPENSPLWTNSLIMNGAFSTEREVCDLPTPQSLIFPDIPSPQSAPTLSTRSNPDKTQPKPHPFHLQKQNELDIHALRLIHAFVPIFPFRELAEIISECEIRKDHNIHAAFFLNAFHSLSMSTVANTSLPPSPGHHAEAQQQAMQAYFALISYNSSVVGRDTSYTAAGLVYLAVRAVFTHGWGKETSTWLRFAADVIGYLPLASSMQLGFRCWLARIIWLWDKGLTYCEPALPSILENSSSSLLKTIQDSSPLSALEFDEEQYTLLGLIELCMDLERHMGRDESSPTLNDSPINELFWPFTGLPSSVRLPLCQRVQSWIKSSSVAQEFFLQFDTDFKSDDEARHSFGRVLHLVYYSMIIKLNSLDRVQCGLKKTSLTVAFARLIDAADWIVTTRRLYLWPFAESALRFAMANLLAHPEATTRTVLPAVENSYWSLPSPSSTNPGSPFEAPFQLLPQDARVMLSLIKKVFMDAHSVLDPITASAQKMTAARAVELISIGPRWHESTKPNLSMVSYSSSEALLAGLGQFLANISPHLLSPHADAR